MPVILKSEWPESQVNVSTSDGAVDKACAPISWICCYKQSNVYRYVRINAQLSLLKGKRGSTVDKALVLHVSDLSSIPIPNIPIPNMVSER